MSLSDKAEFNPELVSLFSGIKSSVTSGIAKLTEKSADKAPNTNFSVFMMLAFVALLIGLYIYYFKSSRLFENQYNIRRMSRENMVKQSEYDTKNVNRLGIRTYLQTVVQSGVPDTHLVLTNFYVSTVNAAGIFFPAVDGIVNPEAARMAVKGGARGFVFDLWPDLSAGAQFSPTVQIVESGSLWRRITMNAQPFVSVLKVLIQEAFEIRERPGFEDPVFLYLRFRGKPRAATYAATANALRAVLEQYRLDPTFNNRRGQQRLFSMPITALFKKVVIVSNVTADGNPLSDFINVGPSDGLPLEYSTNLVKGFNEADRKRAIEKIKQNITWVAPLSEDPLAESNVWDVAANQAVGVHFCAMNFWNNTDTLKAYMDAKMFGIQSFAIKPLPLRYVVEMLPPPKFPQDPKWGSGTTAGTPTPPPSVQLP
jgi:hypothetical protein